MIDRKRSVAAAATVFALGIVPAALAVAAAPAAVGERPPAIPDVPSAPSPASSPAGPVPTPIPTVSTRLSDLSPRSVVAPVGVEIEALGVDAPVDAVGVEPGSGAMVVPDDPDRIGWYRHGLAPGDPAGVAVLTAHVDSAVLGAGAFFHLRSLEPGDVVEVALEDGRTLAHEVVGREQVGKDDLPVDALFRSDGPPALALVTCGGEFDPVARRYSDNVIVWAVPV